MNTLDYSLKFARCTAVLTVLAGGLSIACAQNSSPSQTVPLNLTVPASSASTDSAFSSSAADNSAVVAENHFDFVKAATDNAQPGQRRYGRPRYRGGNTNPDGSNKYTFLAGAGFTQPVGNTYHYLTPSYGIQVGVGRNFNKQFGLIAQFDYDHFGFNGRTLASQQALYNYYCPAASQAAGLCSTISGLDGNSHIWSFTLNPTYSIYSGEGLGAYVVAGVGFYHKVANFTVPTTGVAYDPYYGYYQYAANETIDHYTSNAPGFSGGFGLTYKVSRFANEKLYGEARYVYIVNSQRTGVTINSSTATLNAYQGNNAYPANSNRTSYFPVKFGLRF